MDGKKAKMEFVYPELLEASIKAMSNSYCPYSNFPVGAAILCENENIFSGCNVENACFGLTMCAERAAVCKAVSEGFKKFKAIVITSSKCDEYITPCGACRQVLSEFGADWDVYLTKKDGNFIKYTVAELLPYAFCQKYLNKI